MTRQNATVGLVALACLGLAILARLELADGTAASTTTEEQPAASARE